MKMVNKIFLGLLIILGLMPFGEYFVNRWRADERPALVNSVTVSATSSSSSTSIRYSVPDDLIPTTFTDYLILQHDEYVDGGSYRQLNGLANSIVQLPFLVIYKFSGLSLRVGGFVTSLVALACYLSYLIYLALILFALYLTVFIPFYLYDIVMRRKS